MSELIAPPSNWKFRLNLDAASLTSQLGTHRLLCIKSFLAGSTRLYSGVSVKDGQGNAWSGKVSKANLKTTLGSTFRLTALDCFEEKRKTFCAAAWVKNTAGIIWNWDIDLTASQVNARLEKDKGKLISIRAYKTTLGGQLASPKIRYCAIWVKDDGVEWDWIPDALGDSIVDTLDLESGLLVSIDNLDNDTWLGDNEHFCAVWYKNVTGQVWFWNFGLNKTQLPKEPPKFCSWGLDVSYCETDRFVSLMEQFPKPGDPNLASLMGLTGSASATFRDDLGEDIVWQLQEQNLSAETLQLESAFMFSAAEGGWCWWSGNFLNPAGQTIMGLPLSLNASQSATGGQSWAVSNAPKIGIFPVKAVAPSGKHQFLLAQALITQTGFPVPAALPINWPVFLGIQAPVEVVKLTNGKSWCTVAAQIINGTGQKLDVTNASVRLRDPNGVTLHKANLTSKMLVDQNVLGNSLDPVLNGPVANSDAPLPKFYDGFEVPRTFENGTVKVQGNVKFKSGALDCYGDSRTLEVKRAPVTNMSRLPYGLPKINGVDDPSFRWRWGNGVGGTTFNAHSYPEHRYSYDIVIWDTSNSSFADSTKLDQNDNFHAWGQEVLAISDGDVIFAYDDFEDHFGRTENPNSKGANVVVIYNKTLDFYHLYVHFQKDKVYVAAGDPIVAGQKLGLVGNSGGSSEPHLHLGISRRDAEGFHRSLPMTFSKIKNGAGTVVTGVPVDGEFYS
jgi:Peptidase family M23